MAATINFDVKGKTGQITFGRKGPLMVAAVRLPNGHTYGISTDVDVLEKEAKAVLMNRVGWNWDELHREAKHIAKEAAMDKLMQGAQCEAEDMCDAEIGADGSVHKRTHRLSAADAKLYKAAPYAIYGGRPDSYMGVQTGKLPFKVVNGKGHFYNVRTGAFSIKPLKGGLAAIAKKIEKGTIAAGKAARATAKRAAPIAAKIANAAGVPPGVTNGLRKVVDKASRGSAAARKQLADIKSRAGKSKIAAKLHRVAAAVARDAAVANATDANPAPMAPVTVDVARQLPAQGGSSASMAGGGGGGGASDSSYTSLDDLRGRGDEDPQDVYGDADGGTPDQGGDRSLDEDDAEAPFQPEADGGTEELDPEPATSEDDSQEQGEDASEDLADEVGAVEIVGDDGSVARVSPEVHAVIAKTVKAAKAGHAKAKRSIKSLNEAAKGGSKKAQRLMHVVALHFTNPGMDHDPGANFVDRRRSWLRFDRNVGR